MSKVWQIAPVMPAEFKDKFPEINPVILQLLYSRNIDTQEKIDEFFNPDYGTDIHDPFLFIDMSKAVKRIFQAVERGEKITVHGDYDADGVTSSAVMMSVLEKLVEVFGQKDKVKELLNIYIPHREKEGYGLKLPAVKEFITQKVNLLITVDCGVASKEEVEFCGQAGIDVIITDHHQEPLQLPVALAMINPHLSKEKYPFKDLAGVGVAFKLAQALIREAQKRTDVKTKVNVNWEGFEKWLLDLVAVGTVADVMPILGENRTLVKYGLIVLNKTPRLGLQALFHKASIGNGANNGFRDVLPAVGLNTYSIAFQIAPRLNAAGRMDHANTAYALLMTDDIEEAENLADQITENNIARQNLTGSIISQVEKEFARQLKDGQKLLIVLGEDWPTGILGLVAGKLCDRFCRPTIVAAIFEGKIVGSGRSLAEFNIINTLQGLDKYLANYGGHPAACGFTLKHKNDFDKFKNEIQKIAGQELKDADLTPVLEIAGEINLVEITWGFYDELIKMEPFGEGNPRPLLAARKLEVDRVDKLGKDGKHLKILVKQKNGLIRKLIGFGLAENFGNLQRGDKIDVVLEIGINEWRGNRELQLKIVDLKMGG